MIKENLKTEVSVVRCAGYERERVLEAVRRSVDLNGGIHSFIRPGERVLLKPNLLKAAAPEMAVTTHPEIVRAVIRLVHEAGAVAVVGDSPGFGDLRRVCEKTGILNVIEEEGARLADMDDVVQIRNKGQFHYFEIARAVHEADAVINLPKLKTHGMMTITGALKNLFGCIPGKRKVQWHFKSGVNRDAFARMIVELCFLIKPRLTIMDAVVGMEGNGPGSGDPRQIGVVIAGQDPAAVDVISGVVINADPRLLYTLRAAADACLGETDPGRIAVRGEKPEDVAVKGFRFPPQEHLEWRLPEWARRFLKNSLTTRPVINHAQCIRCGICQGHCPQGAIRNDAPLLSIRYRDCIRCFCCQEFCPKGAITVGKGWLLNIIG